MELAATHCCSLAHLFRVRNENSAKEIVEFIRPELGDVYHPKCLFAVTTPDEKVLGKTLESVGFKKTFLFPRVEEPGMLTLWVALLSDIKMKPKAAKRKASKSNPRKTR